MMINCHLLLAFDPCKQIWMQVYYAIEKPLWLNQVNGQYLWKPVDLNQVNDVWLWKPTGLMKNYK